MKQFGETLGRHDRVSQQKQIMLTLTHLEREENEARDKQARYEKMVKKYWFFIRSITNHFILIVVRRNKDGA